METLKELLIDATIVFVAWFAVEIGGAAIAFKGLTCGRTEAPATIQK